MYQALPCPPQSGEGEQAEHPGDGGAGVGREEEGGRLGPQQGTSQPHQALAGQDRAGSAVQHHPAPIFLKLENYTFQTKLHLPHLKIRFPYNVDILPQPHLLTNWPLTPGAQGQCGVTWILAVSERKC